MSEGTQILTNLIGLGFAFGVLFTCFIGMLIYFTMEYTKKKRKLVSSWFCKDCKNKYEFAMKLRD